MSVTRHASLAGVGTEWDTESTTLCGSLTRASALAGKVSLENPEFQACKEDDITDGTIHTAFCILLIHCGKKTRGLGWRPLGNISGAFLGRIKAASSHVIFT